MAISIDFSKKFNVGLPLDTEEKDFGDFLKVYSPFIDRIYFSLPLGEKFHTRSKIVEQFNKEETVSRFWRLILLTEEFGVKRELVLNTYKLNEKDVENAAEMLSDHRIDVHSVSFLDEYYGFIQKYFPNKEYIYSYNNGLLTKDKLAEVKNEYEYMVLGSGNVRNNALFKAVKESGRKVLLLLNNGCSFNCPGCWESDNCTARFNENLKTYPLDYLYALQSVMPFELYDGTIDLSLVDMFKLSGRSSDIGYLKRCMDSYMTGKVKKYLFLRPKNYNLWARLAHFDPYARLNLKKIIKYKEQIVGHRIEDLK